MQIQTHISTSLPISYYRTPAAENIKSARLDIDSHGFQQNYEREPFGFSQNLHTIDLFDAKSLARLCDTFSASNRGYFIAAGAPSGGTDFYSVPRGGIKPTEALERLDTTPLRILLKRPENQDRRFRDLLEALFRQVIELDRETDGGIGVGRSVKLDRGHVLRLESAVLITSASTITPIHFDPVIGFFAQIEGEKIYHVYSPCDTHETELERFYIRGVFDIGAVKLERRNPVCEHVFHLSTGLGFHQPQNACHWVETGAGRSVSYTFVFQTDAAQALGRTRAFNHYERKLGVTPALPGIHPRRDAVKAETMRPVIPLRQRMGRMLDAVRKKPAPKSL